MATERWISRDLPVLQFVAGQFDAGRRTVDHEAIVEATGLTQAEADAAVRNLTRGGYLEAHWEGGGGFFINKVTERTLREVGIWPSAESTADALISFLEQRAEAASSPEERSRWTKIRDAFAGAGRDITVEVAAAVAAKSMGL